MPPRRAAPAHALLAAQNFSSRKSTHSVETQEKAGLFSGRSRRFLSAPVFPAKSRHIPFASTQAMFAIPQRNTCLNR